MWKADHDSDCKPPRFYTKYHDYTEDCAEDELDNPASLSDMGVSGVLCSSCQAPAVWEEGYVVLGANPFIIVRPSPSGKRR